MSEKKPAAAPNKVSTLVILLSVALVAAIILAVFGFVGKNTEASQNADLKAQLADSQTQLTGATDQLTASGKDLTDAQAKLTSLQADLDKATADFAAYKTTAEAALSDATTKGAGDLSALKAEYDAYKKTAEAALKTAKDETAAAVAKNDELTKTVTTLNAQLAQLTTQVKELQVLADVTPTPTPTATPTPTPTPTPKP
ncbi:MAG TPA: hypothetical protein PLR69_09140, partial [Candidatus Limiplasma sp.]|nr:hypothetical protein [Candidatus Limiplasma sp.]